MGGSGGDGSLRWLPMATKVTTAAVTSRVVTANPAMVISLKSAGGAGTWPLLGMLLGMLDL